MRSGIDDEMMCGWMIERDVVGGREGEYVY
jgi:hypothetical protein